MNFTPKTEEELALENLLPAGEYDFEVISAEDARSSKGNDMIKLKLRIFHDESERQVFDYLMEAVHYKLKHFCDAADLAREYESGVLKASMCNGRAGRLRLAIEKDKTGQYSDKNAVKDYIPASAPVVSMPRSARAAATSGPSSANDGWNRNNMVDTSDVPF